MCILIQEFLVNITLIDERLGDVYMVLPDIVTTAKDLTNLFEMISDYHHPHCLLDILVSP